MSRPLHSASIRDGPSIDEITIDEITAEDLCGDYPAVRSGPPVGELSLDVLTRLGEATS